MTTWVRPAFFSLVQRNSKNWFGVKLVSMVVMGNPFSISATLMISLAALKLWPPWTGKSWRVWDSLVSCSRWVLGLRLWGLNGFCFGYIVFNASATVVVVMVSISWEGGEEVSPINCHVACLSTVLLVCCNSLSSNWNHTSVLLSATAALCIETDSWKNYK